MTETNVVEITVLDSENYERTFRIDNPKSNLTLAQVQAAFATPISEQWLFSSNGSRIVSVPRAVVSVTTKTKLT